MITAFDFARQINTFSFFVKITVSKWGWSKLIQTHESRARYPPVITCPIQSVELASRCDFDSGVCNVD